MEGLLKQSAFADLVARAPALVRFTLVDVGCSAGIDPAWRTFGRRLTAWGFDPNLKECARLQAGERLPGVHYVPAFVGVRLNTAHARGRVGRTPWSRNPWSRLSTQHSIDRQRSAKTLSASEKARLNLWSESRLADPAAPVFLHEFLPARGVHDVDFLKIDVDGVDLGILESLTDELATWRVLGVGLEVNFFGSDDPTDHTLHAMDRFMRARGFDLFDLSVRRYSLAALPAPYVHAAPAQTTFGRPLQGDALYIRDSGAENLGFDAAKLLKLAAIASLGGVPDLAADILLRHRPALAAVIDVDQGLDLLASQAQPGTPKPLGYAAYLSAFERDDPMFYSRGPHDPTAFELKERLAALERSTSWRVTAPLRWLAGLLRRRRPSPPG